MSRVWVAKMVCSTVQYELEVIGIAIYMFYAQIA